MQTTDQSLKSCYPFPYDCPLTLLFLQFRLPPSSSKVLVRILFHCSRTLQPPNKILAVKGTRKLDLFTSPGRHRLKVKIRNNDSPQNRFSLNLSRFVWRAYIVMPPPTTVGVYMTWRPLPSSIESLHCSCVFLLSNSFCRRFRQPPSLS